MGHCPMRINGAMSFQTKLITKVIPRYFFGLQAHPEITPGGFIQGEHKHHAHLIEFQPYAAVVNGANKQKNPTAVLAIVSSACITFLMNVYKFRLHQSPHSYTSGEGLRHG